MANEATKAIGSLWLSQTKGGDTYMSGNINGQKIVVFKNKYKEAGDSKPDYRILESKPMSKGHKGSTNAAPSVHNIQEPELPFTEDDIPF